MTHPDIDDWLGDFATEVTDDQKSRITAAWERIREVIEHDDESEILDATTGAAAQILGDTTLEEAGRAVAHAGRAYYQALDYAQGVMIAAHVAGDNPHSISTATGMSYPTVRRRLGL